MATPGYKDSDGYVNLGWLYRNTNPKRTEESIAAYKKALELNPKEEQAALGMGWSYINLKNWDGAIAAFNQAVQIDPTTAAEANNAIGWSYLFKKDAAKAQEYCDKGTAAGRADARLKTNIERLEKGLANEQDEPDVPALRRRRHAWSGRTPGRSAPRSCAARVTRPAAPARRARPGQLRRGGSARADQRRPERPATGTSASRRPTASAPSAPRPAPPSPPHAHPQLARA